MTDPASILQARTAAAWFDLAAQRTDELLLDHANVREEGRVHGRSHSCSRTRRTSSWRAACPGSRARSCGTSSLVQQATSRPGRAVPAAESVALRGRAAAAHCAVTSPGRRVDLLLCGALIEARSYERFTGLVRAAAGRHWRPSTARLRRQRPGTLASTEPARRARRRACGSATCGTRRGRGRAGHCPGMRNSAFTPGRRPRRGGRVRSAKESRDQLEHTALRVPVTEYDAPRRSRRPRAVRALRAGAICPCTSVRAPADRRALRDRRRR